MSADNVIVRRPPSGLRDHAARTLQLALPVVGSRFGLLALIAVDTAMVGHAGGSELAAYALSMAPQVPMMLFGVGLLMGVVVLASQAVGANREEDCGKVLSCGLGIGLVLGMIVALLCLLGEPFLLATGQSARLARAGGEVVAMFGIGLPGMFLYVATVFFLEGINRPKAGMVVMLFANLLNVALNWLLIYGNLGLPAMGASGAALATSLVRWFMFVALFAYLLMAIDRKRYGLDAAARRLRQTREMVRRLRRIGLPVGLGMVLESGAFSSMLLFAGRLGEVQIAAYQLAMNLVALVFMASIGFGTAASVRVGNAVGRGDAVGMRLAGWTAVVLGGGLLVVFGVLTHYSADLLAGVYTDDLSVLAVAVPTIGVAALLLVPDGVQAIVTGALRGAADAWPATGLYLVSFWLVMMPLGWYLGVELEGGAPGLMVAVLVGATVASLCLGLRFHAISRRGVERI